MLLRRRRDHDFIAINGRVRFALIFISGVHGRYRVANSAAQVSTRCRPDAGCIGHAVLRISALHASPAGFAGDAHRQNLYA